MTADTRDICVGCGEWLEDCTCHHREEDDGEDTVSSNQDSESNQEGWNE